jgi:hypothetical protein
MTAESFLVLTEVAIPVVNFRQRSQAQASENNEHKEAKLHTVQIKGTV